MRQRILLLSCTLLTLGILAACSKSSTSPAAGVTGPGSGPSFDFTFPATGASSSFTFPAAGTFGYRCVVHAGSGMTGTVIVSASATLDSVTVQVGRDGSNAPALAFNPSTVTIKPGGTVRWFNPGTATNHTVTRP